MVVIRLSHILYVLLFGRFCDLLFQLISFRRQVVAHWLVSILLGSLPLLGCLGFYV